MRRDLNSKTRKFLYIINLKRLFPNWEQSFFILKELNDKLSNNFNKVEKLKSRKLIEELFSKGDSFLIFPIKVLYMTTENHLERQHVNAGVSVSSKKFRKAVDRNRIKRLLRENYRLNKNPLNIFLEDNKVQLALFMIYIDKELPRNKTFQKKMPLIIEKLKKIISEKIAINN